MARVKKIGAVGDMVPENPGLEHTIHYLAGLSCEIDKTLTTEQHKAAKRMYDAMVASLSGGKAAGLNVQTHVLIIALLQLLKRV